MNNSTSINKKLNEYASNKRNIFPWLDWDKIKKENNLYKVCHRDRQFQCYPKLMLP